MITSSSRWFTDLEHIDLNAGPTDEHPMHVTRAGAHSMLLGGVLAGLRELDQAVIAGARAALGYPPRLPEPVPNDRGTVEAPARGPERTPLVPTLLRSMGLAHSHASKFNV